MAITNSGDKAAISRQKLLPVVVGCGGGPGPATRGTGPSPFVVRLLEAYPGGVSRGENAQAPHLGGTEASSAATRCLMSDLPCAFLRLCFASRGAGDGASSWPSFDVLDAIVSSACSIGCSLMGALLPIQLTLLSEGMGTVPVR